MAPLSLTFPASSSRSSRRNPVSHFYALAHWFQIAEAHGGVLQLANRSDRTGCEAVLALPITYDGAAG